MTMARPRCSVASQLCLSACVLHWFASRNSTAWVAPSETVDKIGRRQLLQVLPQTVSAVSLGLPAKAEDSKRLAVVEAYPPFSSLVPLSGVFGLAQAAAASDDLAPMRKRFGQLTDTDLDAYRFVCTQYIGLIRYADPDEKVVSFDKAGRFKACDDALAAVARARELLLKEAERAEFQKEVSSIGLNLASFFALIPKEDFKRSQDLSQKLRALDADKDNRLSDEETKTVRSGGQPLSQEDLDVVDALRKVGFGNLLIP
eukprot:symbB.v1.2.031048.t1/scaffold3436.1/size58694/9